MITDIKHNENKDRYEKLIENLKIYDKKYGEIVNEYNQEYKDFQNKYNALFESEYLPYYYDNVEYEKSMAELETKIRNLADSCEFGMFDFVKKCSKGGSWIFDLIEDEIESLSELKSIMTDWNEYVQNTQNYAFGTLLLESVKLVGATCIGINSQKRFNSLEFDVAIIDEAGQIQLQNALVPMSVAKKQ